MSSPLTWATTSGTPSRSASGSSGVAGCSVSVPASAEAVSSADGDSVEASSSLGVQAVSARAAATQTVRKERLMRMGRTPGIRVQANLPTLTHEAGNVTQEAGYATAAAEYRRFAWPLGNPYSRAIPTRGGAVR